MGSPEPTSLPPVRDELLQTWASGWLHPLADKAMTNAVAPEAIAKVIAFLVGGDAWPISGVAIPVYGWW